MSTDTIEALGFTTVKAFQRAWNLGKPLAVDGIVGPLTRTAASLSVVRRQRRQPDISANYSVAQFACHCGGRLPGCQYVLIDRGLLVSLENQRQKFGHDVGIVDGYRCPAHNRAVGGATDSQHLTGMAADISTPEVEGQLVAAHLYAGLGVNGSRHAQPGRVAHVDRRDLDLHDPTGGTLARPMIWFY